MKSDVLNNGFKIKNNNGSLLESKNKKINYSFRMNKLILKAVSSESFIVLFIAYFIPIIWLKYLISIFENYMVFVINQKNFLVLNFTLL